MDSKLVSTTRRRALSERNKTAVMLMCDPWWVLPALMPLHAFTLGAEALLLLITGVRWRKVAGIYGGLWAWMWRNRREIMRHRCSLQSRRAISGLSYVQRFRLLPHKLRMLLRHGIPTLR